MDGILLTDPRRQPDLQCEAWGQNEKVPLFVPHKLLEDAVQALLSGVTLVLAVGNLGLDNEQSFATITQMFVSSLPARQEAGAKEEEVMETLLLLAESSLEQAPGTSSLAWLRAHWDQTGILPTPEESRIHRALLPEPWQSLAVVDPTTACLAFYRFPQLTGQSHGFVTTRPVLRESWRFR